MLVSSSYSTAKALTHVNIKLLTSIHFADYQSVYTDLHPGNVLYHENTTDSANSSEAYQYSSEISDNWRLSFIDAGLVSTLDKQDRKNFVELFTAVVVNNGKRVGELMVDRSRDGGAKCIDRGGFCIEIGKLVDSVHISGALRYAVVTCADSENNHGTIPSYLTIDLSELKSLPFTSFLL